MCIENVILIVNEFSFCMYQTHPGEIHLCIAIVKYKTKLKRIRRGVCTKWISQLQAGDRVQGMHITRGTMQLPKDPQVPVVMIGPGTGIAPMRSFLEDRIYHHASGMFMPTWNILLCRN
jgi:sulfite reductase alpha subunit-like flavoprotein